MTGQTHPTSLGADGPMVRFSQVTKRYGPLTVLDSLDLDVSANEMVSIIGPSGSGKTTVLRMLMTLEEIDEGVIYVDGNPLTHMDRGGSLVKANAFHLRRQRTNIGMVFQHFNLFPHMTALQNCMEAPVQVLGLCSTWSGSPTRRTSIPRVFRAASSSASRSPGRWPCAPR
jgi:polar amino acid transport system ATP-binding protein